MQRSVFGVLWLQKMLRRVYAQVSLRTLRTNEDMGAILKEFVGVFLGNSQM